MPTLLAAAGTAPAAAFQSDGIDLRPALRDAHSNTPRSLFWRYKHASQQAHVNGDWKYLQINGNSFLFNVVVDQMERADLKIRHPDIFARLKQEWLAWNATMLPETPENYSWGPDPAHFADRNGAADDLLK